MSEEIKTELKQCSRCHSRVTLEHYEKNRKGEWFKLCNNFWLGFKRGMTFVRNYKRMIDYHLSKPKVIDPRSKITHKISAQ